MKPIELKLPQGAEASNYLYAEMTLGDLTQDVLTVRLANGLFVDVGWYPEHDPNGRYLIRVFREYWDHQVSDPIPATSVDEVVFLVEALAQHYSEPIVRSLRSGSNRTERVLV